MKIGRDVLRAATTVALPLLLLGQCQREDAPATVAAPAAKPPAADSARVVAQAPPPPAAAADEAAHEAADDVRPPPSTGGWLNGNIYKFRMEGVRPCMPPAGDGAARVGVLVRVMSNINELLVAPRDFKLQSGGVILDSAIAQKAPAGCAPLLAPKSLRAGKVTDGVVVFDVPPGFNPEQRPVRVAYQPTRWGGAKRVEAVLPSGSLPR